MINLGARTQLSFSHRKSSLLFEAGNDFLDLVFSEFYIIKLASRTSEAQNLSY